MSIQEEKRRMKSEVATRRRTENDQQRMTKGEWHALNALAHTSSRSGNSPSAGPNAKWAQIIIGPNGSTGKVLFQCLWMWSASTDISGHFSDVIVSEQFSKNHRYCIPEERQYKLKKLNGKTTDLPYKHDSQQR